MAYIRHDANNNPVSPQPGVTTVSYLGGQAGWSTVTYENYNSDYIAYTYNSPAGIGTRTPGTYQARNADNTTRTPAVYIRHDETNLPKPVLDLRFALNKSLTDHISGNNLITFSRASIATYVGADGLIKTAATDEARFDHDPVTGDSLGLLIEEDRTNNISNDFATGSSTTGATLSRDDSITNPDGTTGAIKLTATAGSERHRVTLSSSAESDNYAYSFFVKKGNHRYVGLSQGGAANNIHCLFDFDTKTIFDDGGKGTHSFVLAGFEEYANGWFRLHVVGTSSGTGLTAFLAEDDNQNGLQSWTATGSEFMYVWGAQKELGDFPTSYIPTDGSTVTRAAEVAEITGTNFSDFYNQSEGTVFSETTSDNSSATPNVSAWGFDIDATSFTDRIWLYHTKNQAISSASGTTTFDLNRPDVAAGATLKAALAFKDNDAAYSDNGNAPTTDTSVTLPTVNRLYIGQVGFPNSELNGHIKRLAYMSSRLPNTILQNMTS